MNEDGGDFVERVEDERVAPDGYGQREGAGGVREVHHEERRGGGRAHDRPHARKVRKVAEVEEEPVPPCGWWVVGAWRDTGWRPHGALPLPLGPGRRAGSSGVRGAAQARSLASQAAWAQTLRRRLDGAVDMRRHERLP